MRQTKFGFGLGALIAALCCVVCGCRTVEPMRPPNIGEAGWSVRQGQAVWKPGKETPDIAGEVIAATHSDGRTMVQFSKNPLPLVTAQTSENAWQIEFVPQKREFSGRGIPPSRFLFRKTRLLWVNLARSLKGAELPEHVNFEQNAEGWMIRDSKTGETITGFFEETR